MVASCRERDATPAAVITDDMIAAGVAVYEEWEPHHVFEGAGGPAPYAIRELVQSVYLAMHENSRGGS